MKLEESLLDECTSKGVELWANNPMLMSEKEAPSSQHDQKADIGCTRSLLTLRPRLGIFAGVWTLLGSSRVNGCGF